MMLYRSTFSNPAQARCSTVPPPTPQTFSSVTEALMAGFSITGSLPTGYAARQRTANGWIEAQIILRRLPIAS